MELKRKLITPYFWGIVLVVLLVFSYTFSKRDNERLRLYGKKTKAIVVEVVNRKRGIDLKYKYFINNRYYEAWDKVYEYYNVDTIDIIYYPNDPELSKIIPKP